jgi:hypothetical protein
MVLEISFIHSLISNVFTADSIKSIHFQLLYRLLNIKPLWDSVGVIVTLDNRQLWTVERNDVCK